ncbi:MAG: hypothetical protein ACOY46_20665 [Bacillota bacterium]
MNTLYSLKENPHILRAWDNFNQSLIRSGLLDDPAEYEYSPEDDIDPWEEEEKEREYLESVGCDCEGPCGYYGCQKPVNIDRVDDEVCVQVDSRMLKWYWDYLTHYQYQNPLRNKENQRNKENRSNENN